MGGWVLVLALCNRLLSSLSMMMKHQIGGGRRRHHQRESVRECALRFHILSFFLLVLLVLFSLRVVSMSRLNGHGQRDERFDLVTHKLLYYIVH